MASSSPATLPEGFEVARHLKRNYAAHSLEGGLFAGGIAFVHPQTLLPRIIERLGGADWMIAAAPILLMVGFFTPSLFITHRLERLRSLKPFVMWIGIVQRAPYLLVGLILLLTEDPGQSVLWCVVLAPLSSGLAGGVSVTAWREYIAKSIPPEKRASLWALRFVIGGVLGVMAGQFVSYVLTRTSEIHAYGYLHLGVFVLMTASFGVLALTREPNLDSTRCHASRSWWSYALSMRKVVAEDTHLAGYLGSRALFSGLYIVLPFLSLHALDVLHVPDGYLGRLLMVQMAGSVVGNLVGGYLGDRQGGRVVMLLSQVSSVVVVLGATRLSTEPGFEALFFSLGVAVGLGGVGVPTLDLEMSNFAQRMSYQTVIGLSHLTGMLGAVVLASTIRHFSSSFALLAWISAVTLVGSLILLLRLPEPRQARQQVS